MIIRFLNVFPNKLTINSFDILLFELEIIF